MHKFNLSCYLKYLDFSVLNIFVASYWQKLKDIGLEVNSKKNISV